MIIDKNPLKSTARNLVVGHSSMSFIHRDNPLWFCVGKAQQDPYGLRGVVAEDTHHPGQCRWAREAVAVGPVVRKSTGAHHESWSIDVNGSWFIVISPKQVMVISNKNCQFWSPEMGWFLEHLYRQDSRKSILGSLTRGMILCCISGIGGVSLFQLFNLKQLEPTRFFKIIKVNKAVNSLCR